MNKRPVIGVTGPQKGGHFAWAMTWLALRRAGAKPVRITTETTTDVPRFDALVLGGGSDISPENYGEELLVIKESAREQRLRDRLWGTILFLLRLVFSIKAASSRKDVERDHMEKTLCRHALENQLPVLGICRGAQLINVALGGTLHQDVRIFYTETPHLRSILPRKRVSLMKDSRLREILGADSCMVNSLHDQAIKGLGSDLVVAAAENNGLVQAVEHTKHPFMIGIQWHPEYLPQIRIQQRLLKSLVETSARIGRAGR